MDLATQFDTLPNEVLEHIAGYTESSFRTELTSEGTAIFRFGDIEYARFQLFRILRNKILDNTTQTEYKTTFYNIMKLADMIDSGKCRYYKIHFPGMSVNIELDGKDQKNIRCFNIRFGCGAALLLPVIANKHNCKQIKRLLVAYLEHQKNIPHCGPDAMVEFPIPDNDWNVWIARHSS